MKKMTMLLLILATAFAATAQTDWSGFYNLDINRNGSRGQLQAQIYQVNGEYWGQLRGNGNEAFGGNWEVEFWTLPSDGSIDCYYNTGNKDLFPVSNALLFSLVGTKAQFTTTLGGDLINAVGEMVFGDGFVLDPMGGKIEEFSAVVVGEDEAVSPSNPAVPSLSASTVSRAQGLLVGSWAGEDASDLTKFFDYEFLADGTGRRGNTEFLWSVVTEKGVDYVRFEFFKSISPSDYRNYVAQVETIENQDNLTILQTADGKVHRIKILGNKYSELLDAQQFKIEELNETNLIFSFLKNEKNTRTLHYKNQ